MAPARSVAASVVALGFAGTLTAPLPALAAPTCERPERYAAQSGAELLRIDRLDLKPGGRIADSRTKSSFGTGDQGTDSETDDDSGADDAGDSAGPTGTAPFPSRPQERHTGSPSRERAGRDSGSAGSAVRDIGSRGRDAGSPTRATGSPGQVTGSPGQDADPPTRAAGSSGRSAGSPTRDTGGQGGGAPQETVSDVGLGNTRSVLIAGAPVSSAGAARILNGKVAGASTPNELVVQQAPPVQPKANQRQTGPKRYGPVDVGAGTLNARAVWAAGMACGSVQGQVSTASTEISRVAIAGGGSGALIRVPEKISSRSGTALRRRGGTSQSVATASITAGRISLIDNEVRLQVLQAPRLTVSAGGKGEVDYRPAIVEVTSQGGKRARLDTAGEHVDITLSDDFRPLESTVASLVPIGGLPLPAVPGLPVLSETENSPIPDAADGSMMRISLGAVRRAADGEAIAAAATAIRVTVIRNDKSTDSQPSGVVADLGIGMLQAAAVAPGRGNSGKGGSSKGNNGTGDNGTGHGGTGGTGGAGHGLPGDGSGAGPGPGTAVGTGSGDFGLPITGPRVASLLVAGTVLIIGGVCAVVITSRRRRRPQP